MSTAPNTLDLHPQPDTDVDMISPCPEALDDLVAQLLISNVDASTQTDLHLPPSVNIQVIIIPSLLGPLNTPDLTPPPSPKIDKPSSEDSRPKGKRPAYCNYCRRRGHLIEECRTRQRNNSRRGIKRQRVE